MILTGRTVAAEEALAIGLVNRIADGDLIEAGKSFAREMTGYSLRALALARDAVHRGLQTTLHEGLAIEADLNTLAFADRGRDRRHDRLSRKAQTRVPRPVTGIRTRAGA